MIEQDLSAFKNSGQGFLQKKHKKKGGFFDSFYSIKDISRLVFFTTVLFLGFLIFICMPRLAVPFILSYIFSTVVSPIIPVIMRVLKIGRGSAIGLIFLAIALITIYPAVKVVPMIKEEVSNVEFYLPKIEEFITSKYQFIRGEVKERVGIDIGTAELDSVVLFLKDGTKNVFHKTPQVFASLLAILEWMFVVPFFMFFWLRDAWHFKRFFLKLAPNTIFERFYYFLHKFNKQLGDYMFAKFIEASLVGTIITIGLLIFDMRFAVILGLVAGITNVIPYVGPILGVVPAVFIAFAEYGVNPTFWGVLALYGIANAIDIALVFPILVSKIVDLHPIVVVVSVILGSQYFGIAGMVVSIPIAAALKLIFNEVYTEIYLNDDNK